MGSEAMNRVQSHFPTKEDIQPMMSRCNEAAEQALNEYPLGVTLAVFAAGLGLGVMVGNALAEPMGIRPQRQAENIGRRILDSIAEYLPASVQQQLHS